MEVATQKKIVHEGSKPLTSKALKHALSGSYQERLEEEKTIIVRMSAGQRPSVEFTGFWNGRLLRVAMDSIAKHYTLRRKTNTHPAIGATKEESDGKA